MKELKYAVFNFIIKRQKDNAQQRENQKIQRKLIQKNQRREYQRSIFDLPSQRQQHAMKTKSTRQSKRNNNGTPHSIYHFQNWDLQTNMKLKKLTSSAIFDEDSSSSSQEEEQMTDTTPEFNSDSTQLQLCRVYHNQDQASDDSIQLHCGLKIYKDGTARQSLALMHVNFDFNSDSISKVELLIPFQLVNIQRSFNGTCSQISSVYQPSNRLVFGALNILNSNPREFNAELMAHIETFSAKLTMQQQLLGPVPRFFQNGLIENKDNEFQSYLAYCFEYLKTLPSGSMYTYTIGRVNPQDDQLEMSNFGYSQAYLDLIGIDPDTLSSLLLRKKKINLLLSTLHTNQLTLNALQWSNYAKPNIYYDRFEFEKRKNTKYQQEYLSEPVRSEILTFDGFKLTLMQRNRVFYKPFSYLFLNGKLCDFSYEYFLEVLELDVELEELEELIRYRQRLVSQNGQMSLQDYLRRELSLMFEDVEYSVRSQEFLEKYYKDGLKQLAEMKEAKEREEERKKEEEQKKQQEIRCGYRFIK